MSELRFPLAKGVTMGKSNLKPIELSIVNGKNSGHYSKKDLQERMDREKVMRIGGKLYKPTRAILENQFALNKWNEIVDIFDGFEFVTDVDTGVIERYCLTYSEYMQLNETKKEITQKGKSNIDVYYIMEDINLHQHINKKLDILLKYEDRIFLNPASRIRNIPAKPEKPKSVDPADRLGFGNL